MVSRWHERVKLLFPGGQFSEKNYRAFMATQAAAVTKPDNTVAEEERLNYDRQVEKFNAEHPEHAMGKTTVKGARDAVLDIIIPGTMPAVGKSIKSSKTNRNKSGGVAYIA